MMSKFGKINRTDQTKAKLTEKEASLLELLRTVRAKHQNDINIAQVSIQAVNTEISNKIMGFAREHHLNLNKNYEVIGEFPNLMIQRLGKTPFSRKPKNTPVPQPIQETVQDTKKDDESTIEHNIPVLDKQKSQITEPVLPL